MSEIIDGPAIPDGAEPGPDTWRVVPPPEFTITRTDDPAKRQLAPEVMAGWLTDDVSANVGNLARAMARYLVHLEPEVDFAAAVKRAYSFIQQLADGGSVTRRLTVDFVDEVRRDS